MTDAECTTHVDQGRGHDEFVELCVESGHEYAEQADEKLLMSMAKGPEDAPTLTLRRVTLWRFGCLMKRLNCTDGCRTISHVHEGRELADRFWVPCNFCADRSQCVLLLSHRRAGLLQVITIRDVECQRK